MPRRGGISSSRLFLKIFYNFGTIRLLSEYEEKKLMNFIFKEATPEEWMFELGEGSMELIISSTPLLSIADADKSALRYSVRTDGLSMGRVGEIFTLCTTKEMGPPGI